MAGNPYPSLVKYPSLHVHILLKPDQKYLNCLIGLLNRKTIKYGLKLSTMYSSKLSSNYFENPDLKPIIYLDFLKYFI